METYSAGGLDMNLLVDNTYGTGESVDSVVEDENSINKINNDNENENDLPDVDLYDNALSDYSINDDDYYNNLNYDHEEESAPIPSPAPKVIAPPPAPIVSLPLVNNNNSTSQKRQKFNPKDMVGLLVPKTKFVPPTSVAAIAANVTTATEENDI